MPGRRPGLPRLTFESMPGNLPALLLRCSPPANLPALPCCLLVAVGLLVLITLPASPILAIHPLHVLCMILGMRATCMLTVIQNRALILQRSSYQVHFQYLHSQLANGQQRTNRAYAQTCPTSFRAWRRKMKPQATLVNFKRSDHNVDVGMLICLLHHTQ